MSERVIDETHNDIFVGSMVRIPGSDDTLVVTEITDPDVDDSHDGEGGIAPRAIDPVVHARYIDGDEEEEQFGTYYQITGIDTGYFVCEEIRVTFLDTTTIFLSDIIDGSVPMERTQ